jgi:phosphoribosylformylglycinamidine synthase
MSVFRVYVEKKKGFDLEAKRMKKDLKEFLHIEEVEDVRIINRYDIDGITEAAYKKALNTIFSEPQ